MTHSPTRGPRRDDGYRRRTTARRRNATPQRIQRHDQVEIVPQCADPAMPRTILEQQHSRQRTALTLPPMLAASLRRPHQARRLQRQPRHRVAQPVAVPLAQLLVEVLHREVRILLAIQPAHPRQLALRRTTVRDTTQTPVPQPVNPLRLIARALSGSDGPTDPAAHPLLPHSIGIVCSDPTQPRPGCLKTLSHGQSDKPLNAEPRFSSPTALRPGRLAPPAVAR
jgi:hypothetical protein